MATEAPATDANNSTASREDVARFTAMADAWWDAGGSFKPLHQINPVRVDYIRGQLCQLLSLDSTDDKPFKGLNIIDIGCGGGILSEPICRLGGDVTGIDAGEKNIEIAKLHAKGQDLDIDYRHVLPEQMDSLDKKFDVVLNMEVIEHVTDPALFMRAASDLLRPGGVMFIATLNRTLKSLALAKIGAEYILRWLPIGTHDWNKFVKPSELAHWLRPNGMEIQHITGMEYNFFQDEWRLSPDLQVNYLLCAQKAG